MSQTPRTDKETVSAAIHGYGEFDEGSFVSADFARDLELENAKLRAACKKIVAVKHCMMFDHIHDEVSVREVLQEHGAVSVQSLAKEAEELAEAALARAPKPGAE